MTTTIAYRALFILALLSSLFWAGCDDSTSSQEEDLFTDSTSDTLAPGCNEGETSCYDGALATCISNGTWIVRDCAEAETCVAGACVEALCDPNSTSCVDEDHFQACAADGSGWLEAQACDEGLSCVAGSCMAPTCEPGIKLCGSDRIVQCSDAGLWEELACATGELCWQGECVDCVRDADCIGAQRCQDFVCITAPLELDIELPDGVVDQPYQGSLSATGGSLPYTWSLSAGALPQGLELSEASISGTPTESGTFEFTLTLEDGLGATLNAELSILIHDSGLVITTNSLPTGMEGFEYSAQVEAQGGTPPFYWGISEGALPAGVSLGADGSLYGTPSEIGSFPVSFKVFDDSLPPGLAQKDLTLVIEIAPLEIYGDTEYDLLLTKVIILPLLAAIEGIPVPYETQLLARGGLRPYSWTELELPTELSFLIPSSGIPDGLSLSADGTLSGSVTDTSQIVTLNIPFTDISLTGFFFMAEVVDSQNPAESQQALFLIPTVPLG